MRAHKLRYFMDEVAVVAAEEEDFKKRATRRLSVLAMKVLAMKINKVFCQICSASECCICLSECCICLSTCATPTHTTVSREPSSQEED